MRRQTSQRLGMLLLTLLAWSGVASAQSWVQAPTPPRDFSEIGTTALQLTDGTIMVLQQKTGTWWQLTPDEHADYTKGTWSKLDSMSYAPSLFAAAVLPDGRVIVEGGETTFSGPSATKHKRDDTNHGAIYDPTIGSRGSWSPVAPPKGWKHIGDAQSVVLPNGTFMLAQRGTTRAALLDAATLNWTIIDGTGKCDRNKEEGWTLLPPPGEGDPHGGKVLTIDTYALGNPNCTLPNNSEIYNPATKTWTSAGNTQTPLSKLAAICGGSSSKAPEIGPAVLRPDRTVFATGVSTCGAGHTAIYDTITGSWTKGKDIPDGNDMSDAPAALLPNGNVLVQTSPGTNTGPSAFYEFEFKTNKWSAAIPPPPGFLQGSSEVGRMLVVASGQIFYMRRTSTTDQMWFYTSRGTYNPLWAPLVNPIAGEICVGCIYKGKTYTVSGTQFNGLSQGSYFGDENENATNYPLVLIENCKTGHKFFARTHEFSTMGVATGLFTVVTAKFDVTPNIEKGASNLYVIANGIPSQPAGGPGCVVTVLAPPAGK